MDAVFDLAFDFIMRVIGGTLSDGTTTVNGILTPITDAVLANEILIVPVALFVIICLMGIVGGIFMFASRMAK